MKIFDINPGLMGINQEPADWSNEQMTQEIQELSSLESLMEQDNAAIGFLKTCEAELTLKQLAVREIAGAEEDQALATFERYGLNDEYSTEAAKDVLARKGYIGVAKIKAIIAAVIKMIQEALTFGTVSNKGFKKIAKYAKKLKESLKRKAGSAKIGKDSFVREITNLEKVKGFLSKGDKKEDQVDSKEDALELATAVLKELLKDAGGVKEKDLDNIDLTKPIDESLNNIKEQTNTAYGEFRDILKEKEEYEKSKLLEAAIALASYVEETAAVHAKDKTIKVLLKAKDKLSKYTKESYIKSEFKADGKNKDGETLGSFMTKINNLMGVLSYSVTTYKKITSLTFKAFDNMITDAKAVEAMAA